MGFNPLKPFKEIGGAVIDTVGSLGGSGLGAIIGAGIGFAIGGPTGAFIGAQLGPARGELLFPTAEPGELPPGDST